jgi:hypothetical protein
MGIGLSSNDAELPAQILLAIIAVKAGKIGGFGVTRAARLKTFAGSATALR